MQHGLSLPPEGRAPAVALAFVHHANQYLITNSYESRSDLEEVVGRPGSPCGYLRVFELHEKYGIPFNLHVSGTLLEAALWHRPDFIAAVRRLVDQGLVELVGSCYGQNIMRFFSSGHNRRQVNEQLALYQEHLGVDPARVKVFWPPERVWDRRRLAPVLTDSRLLNGGYQYVLVDDRTLYDPLEREAACDQSDAHEPSEFAPCRIRDGEGLIAVPISRVLRRSIPPEGGSLRRVEQLWSQLTAEPDEASPVGEPLTVYADDMEKPAGVGGWHAEGCLRLEALFVWLGRKKEQLNPVKLSDWLMERSGWEERNVEIGTFEELAQEFGAGEDYGRWFFNPAWQPYRRNFVRAERRVRRIAAADGDASLLDLAWKHLLASGWETAWHTPQSGVHGNPEHHGQPSEWIRALGSHARQALVIAEAAAWANRSDGTAHAELIDIDEDGEDELVLKNDRLFAVLTPRWGGRLVYLFSLGGRDAGKLVVGNPLDDWNWMEELNKYMQVPANHPGALTEIGREDTPHGARIYNAKGSFAQGSLWCDDGVRKEFALTERGEELRVTYDIPEEIELPTIEVGASPDYLSLLREGRSMLRERQWEHGWSCSNGDVEFWVRHDGANPVELGDRREFGHGIAVRFRAPAHRFRLCVGAR